MNIRCKKCGNEWYEVFKDIKGRACKSCKSSELVWIVSPKYEGKIISEFEVVKWVENPEFYEDKEDPRGNILFDPKIMTLESVHERDRYY